MPFKSSRGYMNTQGLWKKKKKPCWRNGLNIWHGEAIETQWAS